MTKDQEEVVMAALDHPEDSGLTTWEYDWCESIADRRVISVVSTAYQKREHTRTNTN